MIYRIQNRRGTAAEWTAANPILADGEMGYEKNTKKFKLGDGSTAWTSLAYASSGGGAVRLSSVVTNDSHLGITTETEGTDQTAAIQALFDLAGTSPLEIIWDVKVFTGPLQIRSNTRVVALPGCGAKLKANSDMPLLRNSARNSSSITQENIHIEGGIWNANGFFQAHHTTPEGWMVGFNFVGVRNLVIKDLTILAHRTFAAYFCNWSRVRITGVSTDYSGQPDSYNYDGLHFDTGDDLLIDNCVINSKDDGLSFTSNDLLAQPGGDPAPSPFYRAGPITNVVVRKVHFTSSFGIRLLASIHAVDASFDEISGTTSAYLFNIDNYDESPFFMNPFGEGACRKISINRCTASVTQGGEYKPALVYVGCWIDQLSITNSERSNFAVANPFLRVSANGYVKHLTIDGFDSVPPLGATANLSDQIIIQGQVRRFDLRNSNFLRGDAGGGYVVNNTGKIGQFNNQNNNLVGYTGLLTGAGSVEFSNSGNSVDALATPWTKDASVTIDRIDNRWLSISAAAGGIFAAQLTASDANSGNVQVVARLNFSGTNAGSRTGVVFLRSNGSVPWGGTNYHVGIAFGDAQGSPSITITKLVAGSPTTIASRAIASNTLLSSTEYRVYFRATTASTTVNFQVYIQRVSDGLWLTSSNTWVANIGGATIYLTGADSASAILGAGKSGVALYAASTGLSPLVVSHFNVQNV